MAPREGLRGVRGGGSGSGCRARRSDLRFDDHGRIMRPERLASADGVSVLVAVRRASGGQGRWRPRRW